MKLEKIRSIFEIAAIILGIVGAVWYFFFVERASLAGSFDVETRMTSYLDRERESDLERSTCLVEFEVKVRNNGNSAIQLSSIANDNAQYPTIYYGILRVPWRGNIQLENEARLYRSRDFRPPILSEVRAEELAKILQPGQSDDATYTFAIADWRDRLFSARIEFPGVTSQAPFERDGKYWWGSEWEILCEQ